MRLVVLVSVKDCRRKNEQITSRARNEMMIKSSLVIVKATIGKNATSQSEFELWTQKIVSLAPEMKDLMPPILQDTFKQWVSIFLEGIMCTCHVIYTTALKGVEKPTTKIFIILKGCFFIYYLWYILVRKSFSFKNHPEYDPNAAKEGLLL